MPIDLNAVAKMARDSADKEGVLTGFDQLLIGKERVRLDIPLRDTVMLAKHLEVLGAAVDRCRAILSYKVRDERGSLLAARALLREANQKINAYKRIRAD